MVQAAPVVTAGPPSAIGDGAAGSPSPATDAGWDAVFATMLRTLAPASEPTAAASGSQAGASPARDSEAAALSPDAAAQTSPDAAIEQSTAAAAPPDPVPLPSTGLPAVPSPPARAGSGAADTHSKPAAKARGDKEPAQTSDADQRTVAQPDPGGVILTALANQPQAAAMPVPPLTPPPPGPAASPVNASRGGAGREVAPEAVGGPREDGTVRTDAAERRAEPASAPASPGDGDKAAVKPEPDPVVSAMSRPDALPSPAPPVKDQAPVQERTTPAAQVAPAIATVTAAAPAADGSRGVTVQLHPDSLGQVRVQIDQTPDGAARVAVMAERPETLHLLRHDAPELLSALDQAGVPSEGRVVSFQVEPSSATTNDGALGRGGSWAGTGSQSSGSGQEEGAWRRGGGGSGREQGADQGGRRTSWSWSGLDITA
jgi:flagellar hook-length control protein FliK